MLEDYKMPISDLKSEILNVCVQPDIYEAVGISGDFVVYFYRIHDLYLPD